jgi:hypothetical protein
VTSQAATTQDIVAATAAALARIAELPGVTHTPVRAYSEIAQHAATVEISDRGGNLWIRASVAYAGSWAVHAENVATGEQGSITIAQLWSLARSAGNARMAAIAA